MKPLVVIMSLYRNDALDFVRLAVESVLDQSFDQFDLFIQMDGYILPDVDDFLSHLTDNRVHVYRRDDNKGLAHSLNDLLAIVMPIGYDFIARMDADDVSFPKRFEKQVSYLETHPEVDCLGTWAIEINADGSEFYRKMMPETHEECQKLFMIRDCVIHPTVMFRRSFFEKAGNYPLDTYFAEDTMLWANGFANGCIFANLPEYLLNFRINNGFFKRRRGWKLASQLLKLRWRVNKMLHYPIISYCYAIIYAGAKMMPTSILRKVYKTAR